MKARLGFGVGKELFLFPLLCDAVETEACDAPLTSDGSVGRNLVAVSAVSPFPLVFQHCSSS